MPQAIHQTSNRKWNEQHALENELIRKLLSHEVLNLLLTCEIYSSLMQDELHEKHGRPRTKEYTKLIRSYKNSIDDLRNSIKDASKKINFASLGYSDDLDIFNDIKIVLKKMRPIADNFLQKFSEEEDQVYLLCKSSYRILIRALAVTNETINLFTINDGIVFERFVWSKVFKDLELSIPSELKKYVTFDVPDKKLGASGKRELMYSAVLNLIRNSLKYTRAGHMPKVVVSLKELDERDIQHNIILGKFISKSSSQNWWCRLTVADKGRGIPNTALKDIFHIGVRLDNEGNRISATSAIRELDNSTASRSDISEELGIGLAVVKRIVEAHDGVIKIDSDVDVGTKIEIYIPERR